MDLRGTFCSKAQNLIGVAKPNLPISFSDIRLSVSTYGILEMESQGVKVQWRKVKLSSFLP